jgi:hypothetical protein
MAFHIAQFIVRRWGQFVAVQFVRINHAPSATAEGLIGTLRNFVYLHLVVLDRDCQNRTAVAYFYLRNFGGFPILKLHHTQIEKEPGAAAG